MDIGKGFSANPLTSPKVHAMVTLTLPKTIADVLKDTMTERHINQRQLAAYLDVSPQAVSEWLKGTRVPDPPYIWKVAELARMPVEAVMRIAGHLPPAEEVQEPAAVDSRIREVLDRMSPDEQREFALPAIQLAEVYLRQAREREEGRS